MSLTGGQKRCTLLQFYKIGQSSRAMCTNKGGHRDAFLNKWRYALLVSRGPLSRPSILERNEKQGGLFFVIPVNSLVDSTFEPSENVTFAHSLVVSSSSCCWPAVRGVAYAILGSVCLLLSVHACALN